ncbi:MAG: beta-ketoacyl synthase N-terminal-like domain-containing protein [Frankia sp.]
MAITSAAVLHPGAASLVDLDRLLRRGRPVLRPLPVDGAGETAVPAATLDFDLGAWARQSLDDAPAAEALVKVAGRATLPVQSACCVASNAVRSARLSGRERSRTAVIVAGNNLALAYQSRAAAAHATSPQRTRAGHIIDCFDTDALGAVGELTGCTGEGWQIGGSSAAGALALIHGARLVSGGHAPRCLVVAPVNELSPVETTAFVKAGAMARLEPGADANRSCRPFDADRAGFAYGQMAAAVVIEPSAEARRRGVEPLGSILGSAVATDGRRGTGPDPSGQAEAMQAALESAALKPGEIAYVNAHATGSTLGDAAEAEALCAVFEAGEDGPWINSSKGLLGHGLGAAGLIEAVATLLQLAGGYCHANPLLTRPLRPEPRFVTGSLHRAPLRHALSNSFAFSGISASLVLGRPAGGGTS